MQRRKQSSANQADPDKGVLAKEFMAKSALYGSQALVLCVAISKVGEYALQRENHEHLYRVKSYEVPDGFAFQVVAGSEGCKFVVEGATYNIGPNTSAANCKERMCQQLHHNSTTSLSKSKVTSFHYKTIMWAKHGAPS